MTAIYMFPGQGSQSKGMGGKDLFTKHAGLTKKASDILGYSIEEQCLLDPNNQLNKTQYTQPALFVVNALMYLELSTTTGHIKPDIVMGHSLGEYNALFAADVFDFETGLQLVKKRGELMSEVLNGKMAAIIGLDIEKLSAVLKSANLNLIDIANINSSTQIVISGPATEIDKAKMVFEQQAGVMYFPLNVSGAFHSRYMQDKADHFLDFLQHYTFSKPTMPVISNVTACPYNMNNANHTNEITQNLYKQIFSPVKWLQSVQYCRTLPNAMLTEVGPGKVLTNLTKSIK